MLSPSLADRVSSIRHLLHLARDVVSGQDGDPAAAAQQFATFLVELADGIAQQARGTDAVGGFGPNRQSVAAMLAMMEPGDPGRAQIIGLLEDLGAGDLVQPAAFAPGSYAAPTSAPAAGIEVEDRSDREADDDLPGVGYYTEGDTPESIEVESWAGCQTLIDRGDASRWLAWIRGWAAHESTDALQARIDDARAKIDRMNEDLADPDDVPGVMNMLERVVAALPHAGIVCDGTTCPTYDDMKIAKLGIVAGLLTDPHEAAPDSRQGIIMKYTDQIDPLIKAMSPTGALIKVGIAIVFTNEALAAHGVAIGRAVRLSDEDAAIARAQPWPDNDLGSPSDDRPVAIISLTLKKD